MGICLKAIEAAAKANGNKLPTREAVAKAIRALKDYAGITGTIHLQQYRRPDYCQILRDQSHLS